MVMRGSEQSLAAILVISPIDKILPKHDALKAGESRKQNPFARDRIRDTCKDGKLFQVERLTQPTFLQNVREFDVPELFIPAHADSDRFVFGIFSFLLNRGSE